MTPQEAIKWIDGRMFELIHLIKIATSKAEKKRLNEEYQALTVLKSCTESRIKVKAIKSPSRRLYICPACNKFIEKNEQSHGNIVVPYCKWCGQKIDWSDTIAFRNEL